MQLLIFPPSQRLDSSAKQLLDTLQDIVLNVQIRADFCIRHPDYKPLELPTEMVSRFQRKPLDLQNKYMSLQLRSFLYGIYYNGSLQNSLALNANSVELAVHQNLENNTFLGVNLEFYKRLHESNSGEGYFDPGWSVLRQESDGSLAVEKGNLTLHIERDRHLQLAEQSAAVGDSVAIRMPRNLVQNGFYVAASNAGSENRANQDAHPQTVRIYFNLSPEGAVTVMGAITRQLTKSEFPSPLRFYTTPLAMGATTLGFFTLGEAAMKQSGKPFRAFMQKTSHIFRWKYPCSPSCLHQGSL